jgi:hypothetical protein
MAQKTAVKGGRKPLSKKLGKKAQPQVLNLRRI